MKTKEQILEKVDLLQAKLTKIQSKLDNYEFSELELEMGSDFYGKLQDRESRWKEQIELLAWVISDK